MIFVDIDGVLADFNAAAQVLFEKTKSARDIEAEIGSRAFWDSIRAVEDFYLHLPKMADADTLWEGVRQYDFHPTILTGVPMSMPNVPFHKREWCEKYFPGAEVITCLSRDKHAFCQRGDILIDDWPRYRRSWEHAGGIFIVHESAASTLAQLAIQFKDSR